MSADDGVPEPRLDRQGRRLELTGSSFMALGAIVWVPGVVLVLLTSGWAYALGWVLIAIGLLPTIVATALLLSGIVARWAAHHRPFA
ncbi:MAG: hypothetical protein ACRDL8_04930 [Solirubrobacteraceae bacterium]